MAKAMIYGIGIFVVLLTCTLLFSHIVINYIHSTDDKLPTKTLTDALNGEDVGLSTFGLQGATTLEDGITAYSLVYVETIWNRLTGDTSANLDGPTNFINGVWHTINNWFNYLKNELTN